MSGAHAGCSSNTRRIRSPSRGLFSLLDIGYKTTMKTLIKAFFLSSLLVSWTGAGVGAWAAQPRAGVARIDLTPPLDLKAPLGGYGERMSKPATGVRDRVWTKALVLEEGTRRFAVVTADVLAFPPGFKTAVVEALASEGWQADQVLLLPSHTHTSIDMSALNPKNTLPIPQLGMFHREVYERTRHQIAEVIRNAGKQPAPIVVGTSSVRLAGWNRNRRQAPALENELTVTRVDGADGAPLAVMVNWTAHPTFMGPEHMEFSGDWPGHLQRTLEALIGRGVTAMYFNGAEGDQSPFPRAEGAPAWERAEQYGRDLAIEAWRLWERITPKPLPAFTYHVERIVLPQRAPHPDFMQTGGKEYGLDRQSIGPLLEQLFPTETHSTSLQLGDLVIAGVPGELAAALGLQVRQTVRERLSIQHVTIGGLADEWVSYILTPEDYRRGGYEASVSFYGETLGSVVSEAVVRGAARLK